MRDGHFFQACVRKSVLSLNGVTQTKFNTALRGDVRMKRALETVTCCVCKTNGVDSGGNADGHDGDINDCLFQ